MSMHRVSSIETFTTFRIDHHRRESDASTRARKLTFNPLPPEWDPPVTIDHPQAVGAFQVPKWKRLAQVGASVVYCFLAAGLVFGYAAIKPVLKDEGAYRDVCASAARDGSLEPEETCVEMHLNMMFTVAAVATNVAALPVGAILDHYGPRVCGVLASLFLALGALLMAFEDLLPFDGLLFGYFFLALGGPFTYISSFQLSNAFPRHSGFILALLTGAFDASSAIFLGFRLVYNATDGAFGRRRFFVSYLLVPVLLMLVQLTIMPAQSYKTVGELVEELETENHTNGYGSSNGLVNGGQRSNGRPFASAFEDDSDDESPYAIDQVDEETALLRQERWRRRAEAEADRQTRAEDQKFKASGVWGVMHPYSAWEQIKSPWFILICLFTIVQMTRINFFVATIRTQYTSLFSPLPDPPAAAAALNTYFDVALPLGGIIAIPFIGLILDRLSTVTVLTLLVTFATLIGGLGLVRGSEAAAYLGVTLFVVYRPFYYTAVSDYAAKVFGFETFGTVYGAVICLAGVLSLAQGGLDYLFEKTCRGDPVPVNVGLLLAGLSVGVCLVGFVWWKARQLGTKGELGRC